MQDILDFTAFEAGLVLLPGAILTGIMSPITGRIFDKVGGRVLAVVGMVIVTGASLGLCFLDESTSLQYLTVMYAIRMFGLSMVMMPVTTAGLNELPQSLLAHGTAMTNTMRQIAASVGTAILVTVMTTAGERAAEQPGISYPEIFGVNMAFVVLTSVTFVGLILAVFIRKTYPPLEGKSVSPISAQK